MTASASIFDFSRFVKPTSKQAPYVSLDVVACIAKPVAIDPETNELWVYDEIWSLEVTGVDKILSLLRCWIEDAMVSTALEIEDTVVDNGTAKKITKDLSSQKNKIAQSVFDRLLTENAAPVRKNIAESPWSAWQDVSIRWDDKAGVIVTEPVSPEHWCIARQSIPFPSKISLLPTPEITKAWRSMLGPDGTETSLEILETYAGAALLRHNPGKALYLRGEPGIGKSVVTQVIAAMLPESSVITLDFSRDNNFFLGGLPGKSAVVQHEMKDEVLPHQDVLRSAICGEPVVSNEKNKPAVTFKPNAVWIMASNHDLNIGRGARSTLDRFCVVVANGPKVRDTAKDVHKYFQILLDSEGADFKIRCIARFVTMMENNRALWKSSQEESMEEIETLLSENDPGRKFFYENIVITKNPKDRVFMADYAAKYLEWLRVHGGDVKAAYTEATARKFFREQMGITIPKTNRTRYNGKTHQWYADGIAWVEPEISETEKVCLHL